MRTGVAGLWMCFAVWVSAQIGGVKKYRDFAMGRDGDAVRGRELFFSETKTGCAKCHSIDGSASKAGPDWYAAGDKLPRRDLIQSILEPSAGIAVGYGASTVVMKSGETPLASGPRQAGQSLVRGAAVIDGEIIDLLAVGTHDEVY